MRPGKTQISLGIRPVWSESSLSVWRKIGSLATHWAHSEDSDQSGHPGRTVILLVLPWDGSVYLALLNSWACARQNQQNDMCAQRRLRSVWASVQSDQSSLCAQLVAKGLVLLQRRLIRLGGFVMRRLIYYSFPLAHVSLHRCVTRVACRILCRLHDW